MGLSSSPAARCEHERALPAAEGPEDAAPGGEPLCIGLNYTDHAKETGQPIPYEPVPFMKATTAICGPNDNVVLPRGSVKSDWEVEFGIVIGSRASYVEEDDALDCVAGGPLALVRDGDELDVPARKLILHVSDEELARRRAAWQPPEPHSERGYLKLYLDHVMQADTGADLDILTGGSGAEVPRESH